MYHIQQKIKNKTTHSNKAAVFTFTMNLPLVSIENPPLVKGTVPTKIFYIYMNQSSLNHMRNALPDIFRMTKR